MTFKFHKRSLADPKYYFYDSWNLAWKSMLYKIKNIRRFFYILPSIGLSLRILFKTNVKPHISSFSRQKQSKCFIIYFLFKIFSPALYIFSQSTFWNEIYPSLSLVVSFCSWFYSKSSHFLYFFYSGLVISLSINKSHSFFLPWFYLCTF